MPVNDKYWIIILVCAVAFSLVAIEPNNQNPLDPANPIDLAGMAASPISPLFSTPVSTFSAPSSITFTTTDTSKTLTFTVSDDAVYKTGYISIDGNSWQATTLTGTVLGGNWLKGASTGTVNILKNQIGTGNNTNNYIIVYTCTRNGTSWNCHDNKWQIKDFTTIKQETTCTGTTTQSCTITNGAGTQTRTCNNGVWSSWSTCTVTTCTDTCSSKGLNCGTQTICGVSANCGTCGTGYICTTGKCVGTSPPPTGTGNTYYVSTSGSDSNSGTITQPFKTIQKAVDIVKAGDTVIVRDGTYTSTSEYFITFYNGGTTGKTITIKAENNGGAILDGKGTGNYCFVLAGGVSYINIEGFEIKNFREDAIHLNNPENPNSNIVVRDNNIHDIGRACTDSAYGKGGAYIHGSIDITFEGNIFHDIGRYAPGENGCTPTNQYYKNHDHALYIDGVKGLIVSKNVFYNINRGWALHFYPAASSDISVFSNTFDFGNTFDSAGGYGSHIIFGSNLNNVQIKNNIFSRQVNYAIFLYSGTYSNIVISNNLAYGGVGQIIDGTRSGISLSNNLINTNPFMVNDAAFDFNLQSTSPAIDKGVNVGLPYSGSAPDLGAFETQ